MERQSEDAVDCEVVWSAEGVSVSGAIDVANAAVIGQQVRALLAPGDIVVDCRAVTFIDVAGVRMFAGLGIAAMVVGAAVCLRCSGALAQMLALCGVRELPGLVLERGDHDRHRSSP